MDGDSLQTLADRYRASSVGKQLFWMDIAAANFGYHLVSRWKSDGSPQEIKMDMLEQIAMSSQNHNPPAAGDFTFESGTRVYIPNQAMKAPIYEPIDPENSWFKFVMDKEYELKDQGFDKFHERHVKEKKSFHDPKWVSPDDVENLIFKADELLKTAEGRYNDASSVSCPWNFPDSEVIGITLSSETTGHLLPFHPVKVYDQKNKLVATGVTDENGESEIEVPKHGDYYVAVDSTGTFDVKGIVYQRDAMTPLRNTVIEVKTWDGTSGYSCTGEEGELELTNIPEGELNLTYEEASLSVYIDGACEDGAFCIPYEAPMSIEEPDYDDDDKLMCSIADNPLDITPDDF